jgi:hypothetical protein
VSDRREYLGRIETKDWKTKGAPNQPENQSLKSTWCEAGIGGRKIKTSIDESSNCKAVKGNRNYQTSQMGRDHAQDEAEKLARIGLKKIKPKGRGTGEVAGQR